MYDVSLPLPSSLPPSLFLFLVRVTRKTRNGGTGIGRREGSRLFYVEGWKDRFTRVVAFVDRRLG